MTKNTNKPNIHTDWLKKIIREYLELRSQNNSKVWTNSTNFSSRLFSFSKKSNNAFQSLIHSDVDFSYNMEVWFENKINEHKISLDDIKKAKRALSYHLSKTNERILFLITFASFFTILLIFMKFNIINFKPFDSLFVALMGFILVILPLIERTEHIKRKHALEEISLYLDDHLSKLENNTNNAKISKNSV
jgi:hypothetical protein